LGAQRSLPQNVGALIRTSKRRRERRVITANPRTHGGTQSVERVSGSAFRVPTKRFLKLSDALAELKKTACVPSAHSE